MAQARIFVLSDTHFGHENIYRFTWLVGGREERIRKEFANATEGDWEMVSRWNQVVSPEDHVYHLGDVCMDTARHLALIKNLNGHKRLILGNHDKGKMSEYMAAGFQKIMGSRLIDQFLLTHIPVHPNSLTEDRQGRKRINVHGHIHQNPSYGPDYRNVSVERIGYRPVLLNSLK